MSNHYLSGSYTMAEKPFTMGSAARGTICRLERDIDMLAPFSVSEYWKTYETDSRSFLYWVRNGLNAHYGRTAVSSKQVAVVIDFTDTVTDVVPAFRRTGGGYLIPNGQGGWRSTNPPFHTQLTANADQAAAGRLVPLVKLLKAWNFANGHHLTWLHVEVMVERMWGGHRIGEWPAAVAATIKTMPSWLKSAFPDPWPDGARVDRYLADEDRAKVVRMLEEDTTSSAEAERLRKESRDALAFDRWNSVYRRNFPAYG